MKFKCCMICVYMYTYMPPLDLPFFSPSYLLKYAPQRGTASWVRGLGFQGTVPKLLKTFVLPTSSETSNSQKMLGLPTGYKVSMEKCPTKLGKPTFPENSRLFHKVLRVSVPFLTSLEISIARVAWSYENLRSRAQPRSVAEPQPSAVERSRAAAEPRSAAEPQRSAAERSGAQPEQPSAAEHSRKQPSTAKRS